MLIPHFWVWQGKILSQFLRLYELHWIQWSFADVVTYLYLHNKLALCFRESKEATNQGQKLFKA